jgi:peptidoglycan hydrolase CwlO-like protein
MSIPEPWNDNNNCFIYTSPEISAMLTDEQINKILSINTDYTTYIRSNLSITDGADACIPNVFEAINTAYSLSKTLLSEMNSIKSSIQILSSSIQTINSDITNLKSQISTINSDITNIKEQIEELKPKPEE